MKKLKNTDNSECISLTPQNLTEEITEEDTRLFFKIISTNLNDKQIEQINTPPTVFSRQKQVVAVHWHPEFIPLNLIENRINKMFPSRENELIIPTQHNQLMTYKDYAGVEVDCYASGFNQKVQLLLHFKSKNVEDATVLNEMLNHTFKYRTSQLFEFIHAITTPKKEFIDYAVKETGATSDTVKFTQIYAKKIEMLMDLHFDKISPISIKNKLLRDYYNGLRPIYGDAIIDRVQIFLKAVKIIVKAHFPLSYFYRASEVIEEAKKFNAGIVIPHPEQFWPILLADYDVDGYEVWNPQSQRYTSFLISVLMEKNKHRAANKEPLFVFMGDDTHMGEKAMEPSQQNKKKANREIGLQPAWDDLSIRKNLITLNLSRKRLIDEYKARLSG